VPRGHEQDFGTDDGELEIEPLTEEQLHALHGKVDADGDGLLPIDELIAYAGKIPYKDAAMELASVKYLDSSKDGFYSAEELLDHDVASDMDVDEEMREELLRVQAAEKVHKGTQFRYADKDQDGLLNEQEVADFYDPALYHQVLAEFAIKKKDKDRDGVLSPAEHFSDDELGLHLDADSLSKEEIDDFEILDKDGNGVLDVAEVAVWESGQHHTKAELRKMLEKLDQDGDNHLSAQELAAANNRLSGMDELYHLHEWSVHEEL
jgi:Ca2+-binding EF-hand superfamily protein